MRGMYTISTTQQEIYRSPQGDALKVLFVNPDAFHVEQKAAIPLGLLSIATYLAQHGHQVRVYDRAVEGGSIKPHLAGFSPDMVAVSVIGMKSFPDAIRVSKLAKKHSLPVVWGGAMVSLLPDIALKTGVVDYVVLGEGELTMLALTQALSADTDTDNIEGLAYLRNGYVVKTAPREFADLSMLPILNWEYVDPRKYFIKNVGSDRTLHVYSSKGCTGHCTYCYSPGYSGCVWRSRPSAHYLEEIKHLIETYGIDGVFFADDLLVPNRTGLRAFCRAITESGLSFVWGCDLRVDCWSREDLQLLYDSGCRWIFFGIESGSEQRQIAIQKRTDLLKAKTTLRDCKDIGISTTASFIIGFPGETEDELKQTVEYIKALDADVKLSFFYYPTPQSALYEDLIKNGLFSAPDTYRGWMKYPKLTWLGKNFSSVPDRDLKVVSAWLLLTTILAKPGHTQTTSQVYGAKIREHLRMFFKTVSVRSVRKLFVSAGEFLIIVWYAVMFPSVRKKYNLHRPRDSS